MTLPEQIAKDRGQPATVRVGIVFSVSPFTVLLQQTVMQDVGLLGSYRPQIGDPVILLGQSAVSADGSSWLALGVADGASPGRLARRIRTTNVTSNGPENGVIRFDGIPVVAGRAYQIYTTTLNLMVSALNLTGEAKVRIATGGTIATNASAQIGAARIEGVGTFVPGDSTVLLTEYYPTATTTISVLLTWQLIGGVGTVTLIGATAGPIGFFVDDMGPDGGDVGVQL